MGSIRTGNWPRTSCEERPAPVLPEQGLEREPQEPEREREPQEREPQEREREPQVPELLVPELPGHFPEQLLASGARTRSEERLRPMGE